MEIEVYDGREQSAAKHLILARYLDALALKVGQFRDGLTLNYVDGFSGPWESHTGDLSDTSPSLALAHLLDVRAKLIEKGLQFTVRAFFVSLDRKGADDLARLRERFPDAEIEIVTGKFEDHIEDARRFVRVGSDRFAFIFIDPKGWTGFGLRAITPLLRESRTEVLLNFMTSQIGRFIDSGPDFVGPQFLDMFGDASFRDAWRGQTGLDREERMVETYCARLKAAAGYQHCVSAVILNPKADRTHYHLIYGTHSDKGLVAFREIERRAIEFQRQTRADVQQRGRVERTGQEELFGSAMFGPSYEDELRERYLSKVYAQLDALLATRKEAPFDDLVMTALQVPMIAESDVKSWVKARTADGTASVIGLSPRAKVPQLGCSHRICLKRSKETP